MWDHTACAFTSLAWRDPVWLECHALRTAAHEIVAIGASSDNWDFSIGQGIANCRLRIDARIRALQKHNKHHTCISNLAIQYNGNLFHGSGSRLLFYSSAQKVRQRRERILDKEQGAACVIHQRQQRGETLKACNYDEVTMDLLDMNQGPGGCGNMIVKDNSPLRVHAVMLTALESSGSTTDDTHPSRSTLEGLQSNGKIKKEAGAQTENRSGVILSDNSVDLKQEDMKMEDA